MIDTHCHLDTAAFADDVDAVIARATRAGVVGMVVPAIRPRTWPALRALAERQAAAGVVHAVGVHPQIVEDLASDELADLEDRLLDAGRDAVAIGECGLDRGCGAYDEQQRIFRIHVRVARTLGKPLVIHVLRAHDDAPRILKEERCAGGVLHSYSGGADLVPVYRELGLAFSFAGPVTYANARRPVEAARAVPAELLLAETDAPDQAPAAHRGSRSEPAFVADVIAGLARARGIAVDEAAALTTANARRVFGCW
ncbi:MAG TPA: TatD family hydrolase [Kofleriaceae bacterium]|nr:TatD family hydrolase [Kofleriaceae bacterium]